jgi:hypothetical protein
MSKRAVLILLGAAVLVGGWWLFRPELLFVDKSVDEALAAGSSEPTAVATGEFRGVAHDGRGTATIFQYPDGRRVLRFSNFETSNGPALHVYLVAAPDATDNDTVTNAGFVDLGALKGNQGDQNYDVPAGVDLAKYQAVTVWCARFNVNFTTAPLMASRN